ncbi:hypothetical protein NQZ68_033528 [Dissostichus eleginoides]|nr:hypothetical protein NQZ68_033528 [Dissostichus eleginoides]
METNMDQELMSEQCPYEYGRMDRLSESQHVTIVITEKAPACCQLLRDPDLPKIASARPAWRREAE